MKELLELSREYGLLLILLVYVLFNFGKVVDGAMRVIEKISPQWAERRKRRAEREKAEEKERSDIVLWLKGKMNDIDEERKQLYGTVIDIVGKYERGNANIVEVLRDISEEQAVTNGLVRSLTDVARREYEQGDRGTTRESQ